MRPDTYPTTLTPDDRLREVAAVFAGGLLRLQARPIAAEAAEQGGPKNPPDSSPNCLEFSRGTVLSVHTG